MFAMNGFVAIRIIFIAVVVYSATVIGPVDGHSVLSAGLGLLVALVFVVAETRLRGTAVTSLLGGLLGFVAGLIVAKMIGTALFWADTSNTKVQFLHGLIIVVLPYLGLIRRRAKRRVAGAGEIRVALPRRPPAEAVQDSRHERHHRWPHRRHRRDGFLDGTLVVTQFVLKELQYVADSADALKRNRGRRGLDILHRIQKMAGVEVVISDMDFPHVKEVDLKLIEVARSLLGRIVTNDFNLNKVAQLRGVDVLNINELANSLKPVVLPGEAMTVFILKEGKEYNQGVAYLDDGTMVVVDNARTRIGKNLEIVVTSVLQTTAGRMIFGRHADGAIATPQDGTARPSDRGESDPGRRQRPAQTRDAASVPLVADRLLPDSRRRHLHDRAGDRVADRRYSWIPVAGWHTGARSCGRARSWSTSGVKVRLAGHPLPP